MEVRQELLLNVSATFNYDESNKNAAKVTYWGWSVDFKVFRGKLRGFEQREPLKGLR